LFQAFILPVKKDIIINKKGGAALEEYRLHRKIICIDLKSFYASVECSLLGLDPFETPLVVADHSRGGGSIVLAVSPYLKTLGVPNRCRIYELPKNIKIIFRKPQMEKYLEYSTKIIEIYLRFISEEDMYIYSIDETFLDLTEYLEYYKKTDYEIAKMLMDEIYKETKVCSSCGIGANMLMAKLALDLESKNAKNYIAKWNYEDLPEKLWPVKPLSKMWGVGRNMEARLNKMGFYKIGDIAASDPSKLKRRFGVLGEELYYHTHGIDMSMIQDKLKIKPISKSYGTSQVLFRDYYKPEIYQIIIEMVDDITRRLRISHKLAATVHFGVSYSKDAGGGFARQIKLEQPTANESIIYQACRKLFDKHYENEAIRRVHVGVGNLTNKNDYQFNLFEDAEKIVKEQQIFAAMDEIKIRFGKNSINRSSAELPFSTAKARNEMIGGHHA
jgi:DNA polymerase V